MPLDEDHEDHEEDEKKAKLPKDGWERRDVAIERKGTKITLPNEPTPMSIDRAISALRRLKKDEEQEMDVREIIDAHVLEGAVACVQAMKEIYGWASPVPKMTFFGPRPPEMISVEVDVGKYIQVPFGEFKLPNVENNIGLAEVTHNGMPCLIIYGTVRKREQHVLLELAQKTRELLEENSIYKGKPIVIRTDNRGQLRMKAPPTFIDLSKVNPDELVMNRDVEQQVLTNINTPIVHTQAVRDARIPLKRGVLLSGRYGVGKTMTTQITAKLCKDHDWTFIMVERAAALQAALRFAKRYQPCVVFCEDIDRATEERDDAANDLLNVIDGIIGKQTEIMVVLTTNHVEKINPAMLRPGRLDAVIDVAPPDEESVQRLCRIYARGLLKKGETLDKIGEKLAGNIPASIREVVERAKLSMIKNHHDEMTEEDLIIAADGMAMHMDLLKPKPVELNAHERLGKAMGDVVSSSVYGQELDELASAENLDDVRQEMGRLASDVSGQLSDMRHDLSGAAGATKKVERKVDRANNKLDDIENQL